jgi:hypothetical protein
MVVGSRTKLIGVVALPPNSTFQGHPQAGAEAAPTLIPLTAIKRMSEARQLSDDLALRQSRVESRDAAD